MQPLSHALLMSGALKAFQNRLNAQSRKRMPGELRPSERHRAYSHSGNRERERHLRHQAAGRMPADQIGQLVDGRVV
jgi:hypothetical protein